MANIISSSNIYLTVPEILERVEGSKQELDARAEWGIFIHFIFRFRFPVSPEYADAQEEILAYAEEQLRKFMGRIKPPTTRAISWQELGGLPFLERQEGFPATITIQAKSLGVFTGSVQDLQKHLFDLREYYMELSIRLRQTLDSIESYFQPLIVNGVSSNFYAEDESIIPEQVKRIYTPKISLSPEEEQEILKRRKQISEQEEQAIIEKKKIQEKKKPPPPKLQPPKRIRKKSFFERVGDLIRNIFR